MGGSGCGFLVVGRVGLWMPSQRLARLGGVNDGVGVILCLCVVVGLGHVQWSTYRHRT